MTWAKGIPAITLIVDDVAIATEFYQRCFDLPVYFQDDNSVVFKVGDVLLNFLDVFAADELVAPAPVGAAIDGVTVQFTIAVDNVDATVQLLQDRGVFLLRGPEDRPWGIRTATFQDPFGHTFEITD